jgi:hypothetical protein
MSGDEDFDGTVRRALAREADSIEPGADGLHEIRRRIAASRPAPRRRWVLTAGAAVVGTAAAIGLVAVLDRDQLPRSGESVAGTPETVASPTTGPASPTPAPSPTTDPTTDPIPDPTRGASPTRDPSRASEPPKTGEPHTTRAVPVYWMGEAAGRPDLGPRLYRTFVRVSGSPAVEAVRMLAAGKADDPDYSSAWIGARVASVSRAGGTITVDFDELPRKQLGSEAATIAAQALVHTVQGTLRSTDPVRVTLDGGAAGELFGHVDTGRPLRRSPAIDVQAAVWIITPANNAVVDSPVTVEGVAAVYEANVSWRVLTPNRKVALKGFATASAGGPEFGSFKFTAKLPRGTYTLECFESSAEDGRPTFTDSKTLTVR